jgi:poly(A) polymerase
MAGNPTSPLPRLRDADWLRDPATQAVLSCLAASGAGARVVGGAVRNSLLGRPVVDVDIATTARPDEVMAAAAAAGLKTVATGLAHGTVTIIADGRPFEVTTLRRDVATDGRHAMVAFTDDWAADAARRDLTLNALYCDAAGTLYDPIGGFDDLQAGRVRFIGEPGARIEEDYLRILRFFRFSAAYGAGPLDRAGVEACVAHRSGLGRLSAERVRAELLRLLDTPRAVEVIATMAAHGLLTAILPVAPRPGILARLVAIEDAATLTGSPILRLAALAVAVGDDAARLALHLRLSGAERSSLELTAPELAILSPGDGLQQQRAALYRLGPAGFSERVLLDWARSAAAPNDTGWRHLRALPDRWTPPHQPFTGRDLLALGLPPGPRIGQILATFETWWIAADFPVDRGLLEARLQALAAAG